MLHHDSAGRFPAPLCLPRRRDEERELLRTYRHQLPSGEGKGPHGE